MSTKKISFIVVNYNTKDPLVKCVENLVDIWPNKEIIVVDNASTDGSTEALGPFCHNSDFILIKTQNNGLAAGYNLGLARSSGDYICYLGTDAYPTQDAIKKLFGFMEIAHVVGIVTPKLVLRDGSIDFDAHRGFPTPWVSFTHFTKLEKLFPKSNLFARYFLTYKDFSKPHEIDLCISHFMFTRREIYEKVPSWDENFFLFGEDVDFCYRVKKAGFKIVYLPDVEVLHYKGASIGRKSSRGVETTASLSKETRLRAAISSTTAMKTFYTKHYMSKYPKILSFFIMLVIDAIAFLRVAKIRYLGKN